MDHVGHIYRKKDYEKSLVYAQNQSRSHIINGCSYLLIIHDTIVDKTKQFGGVPDSQ